MKNWIIVLPIIIWPHLCRAVTFETLDQDYVLSQMNGYQSYGVYNGVQQAQTFTPAISGYLSRVVIQADKFADAFVGGSESSFTKPLRLSIHTTTVTGLPSSTLLGSYSIAPENISGPRLTPPTLVSVDLSSANIQVSSGQKFAIVLSSELPAPAFPNPLIATYGFVTVGQDYAGGEAWYKYSNNSWAAQNFDFGFQTYVSPIPEPSVLALFFASSFLLLWLRSHRMRRGVLNSLRLSI